MALATLCKDLDGLADTVACALQRQTDCLRNGQPHCTSGP